MDTNKKKEYTKQIHTLQDYIDRHLYSSHHTDELTKITGFSKYHFHRIFKNIQNESLFQYVTRVKLESIANVLIAQPDISITTIAYQFGFSDSAVFSRTFKKYYGISPKSFRQHYRNNCKDTTTETIYTKSIDNHKHSVTGEVAVVSIEAIPVIYKRKTGAYKELYQYTWPIDTLFRFASEHHVLDTENVKVLTVYHSHPDFSEESKQRTSICLSVKKAIPNIDADIGFMLLPAGLYAIAHFEIFEKEYAGAWKFLYSEWLPQSGYVPKEFSPFEVYLNNPKEHPQQKHLVDIYIPIEPIL